jgi:hypothetical protein
MRLGADIAVRLGQIWKPYVFAALAAGAAVVIVAALGALVGQWTIPYAPSTDQPSNPISLDLVAAILAGIALVAAVVAVAKIGVAEVVLRFIARVATRRRDRDCG